jgi:NNMT/PNMT/TEMT family
MRQAQPLIATAPASSRPRANDEFDWNQFGPAEYHRHNYATLREDDAAILGLVQEWFAETAAPGAPPRRGLDVGAGPNLYPALSMLPYCHTITLSEYSGQNVSWLKGQTADLAQSWAPFWERLSPKDSRGTFAQARRWLAGRAVVEQGSIFDLPRAQWEMGTMFFVAESLTEVRAEFERAVGAFLGALRPGAPFAAAFMELSQGYAVGPRRFPALALDEAGIAAALAGFCRGCRTHRIALPAAPLRGGYEGMVVALGVAE